MTDSTNVLDLDALAIDLKVKLGGKEFTAREASVEINKEILRAMPQGLKADSDDPQDQLQNLDAIYPQLAHVLKDDQGRAPTKEHVEKHLTTTGLRALMKALNPGDEDESGNGTSPATTTA